jgi:hypothetical protein
LQEDPPDAVCVELPVTVEGLFRRAVAHLPVLTVLVLEWEDGKPAFLTVSPQDALAEAVRTAAELNIPVHFIDQEVRGYPAHQEAYPDPYLVSRLGLARYALEVGSLGPRGEADRLREQTMVHHLQRFQKQGKRVVFVGGVFHLPALVKGLAGPPQPQLLARVRPRPGRLFALARETVSQLLCLGEAPHLIAAYEIARRAGGPFPNRVEGTAQLLKLSRGRYQAETGEEIPPHSLQILGQYARNLARLEGNLVPDLIPLVTAARGAVDDNFGHAVMELGTTYPFWDHGKLPVRTLSQEELDWARARSLRLFPRITRPRERPLSMPFLRRRREKRRGEWKRNFDPLAEGQCSYPPEDLVIEGYGRKLKDRARAILSESHARTVPFTTSALDGVDVRETLHNWHEGRIYVRDAGPGGKQIGSVVFVFEEGENDKARYSWEMTWWGEHNQESDMAFYATRPEDHVTGPGVARCEYGGFLMSFPPGRLTDVWSDPWFAEAQTRAERLLLAGIEYSTETYIAYVARRPPRSKMLSLAERFGRRIVYIPLGTLSPAKVKEVRVFHVLSSHKVREAARDYIW